MFKRKPKQKKLTLRQVHELYLALKPPEKEKKYLLDEISEILDGIGREDFERALAILEIDTKDRNGIQVLTLFIRKLKEVEFFGYVEFLRKLK